MGKIIISETISRRRILSLAAALGLVTPAAILSASDAEAQTAGTERRQERTTTANAVINVTDAPAGSIPLTYNDVRFSTNTASGTVTIPNNGSLTGKSITQGGGPGQLAASIKCNGSATIECVRVNSREAVRVGGPGTVAINNSYLEAKGMSGDHADTIQTQARSQLKLSQPCRQRRKSSGTNGIYRPSPRHILAVATGRLSRGLSRPTLQERARRPSWWVALCASSPRYGT